MILQYSVLIQLHYSVNMKNVYVRLLCLVKSELVELVVPLKFATFPNQSPLLTIVKSPISQRHFSGKKLLVPLVNNGNKPPYYHCNIFEHFMGML